jgi:DeoR family glycerol-3-phosphate regulon repressor
VVRFLIAWIRLRSYLFLLADARARRKGDLRPARCGFWRNLRLPTPSRRRHRMTAPPPTPRQSALLEALRGAGALTVEALAARFGVTLQTVRRDVQRLADAGLVARFHGGVRLPASTTENIAYRARQQLNAEAKRAIAQAVARAVPAGSSLILNIGTTTEAVAHALLGHAGLRVLTNNLNVAAILSGNPDCEVIVAGGTLRSHDRGIVGEATVECIGQFRDRKSVV